MPQPNLVPCIASTSPQNPQERRLRVTVIHLQFGAVDGQLLRVKVLWQCGEVASPDFGDCAAQTQGDVQHRPRARPVLASYITFAEDPSAEARPGPAQATRSPPVRCTRQNDPEYR